MWITLVYYYTSMNEPDNEPGRPKSILDLLQTREPQKQEKSRRTERGDLITYFHERVLDKKGKSFRIAFIATKLAHLSLQDLYYLKSTCEDASRRGKPFGAIFWWSIKAK